MSAAVPFILGSELLELRRPNNHILLAIARRWHSQKSASPPTPVRKGSLAPTGSSMDALRNYASTCDGSSTMVTLLLGETTGICYNIHGDSVICCRDNLAVIFSGEVTNSGDIKAQYGFRRQDPMSDAFIVTEVYKTWRDRTPFPAEHCLRIMTGRFAFVLYDMMTESVFLARDVNGAEPLYWGRGPEGCIVLSTYPPSSGGVTVREPGDSEFPPGCFFTTKGGLQRFGKSAKRPSVSVCAISPRSRPSMDLPLFHIQSKDDMSQISSQAKEAEDGDGIPVTTAHQIGTGPAFEDGKSTAAFEV
eukprot:jgi/Mesvir1/4313/Mv14046-RA.1